MAKSNWNIDKIVDQAGKVIVITGATSGLGKEAAKQLAGKNAILVLAVRNVKKAEDVKQEILARYPQSDIKVKHLDLGSLSSIKQFAEEVNKEFDHLDILINNAGVMMCPYSKTENGFEIQMGTNHLGPFALTGQLMPLLKRTKDSRIVVTSSIAHKQGNIDFSDLNWEKRKYNTGKAYSDSKIANLYFTYQLAEKLGNDPNAPTVTAAHPGWTKTDLQRHSGFYSFMNNFFAQRVEVGVTPTLRAATDPDARSGDYFGPSGFAELQGFPVKVKSNALSHDTESASKLWEISGELTGVRYI
jgi:NAD(P)-dependent dehydrogenase (short-subunit alcohol dehydrogenase family)